MTSHGGWHCLADCLPTVPLSRALVLNLGDIISLEADKAFSCWSGEAPGEAACYWQSCGGEERPGILLLYALQIPFKKHKLETSSFKEISETASLAHPSRQPRYQMLGNTHWGALVMHWEKCGLHNCPLRTDVMSQSLGKAILGKV